MALRTCNMIGSVAPLNPRMRGGVAIASDGHAAMTPNAIHTSWNPSEFRDRE